MSGIIVGETYVSYKRSERIWTAVNGTLNQAYPAGPEGKQDAWLDAIQHENAELHKLVAKALRKHPDWWKSYCKAATCLINGLVHPGREAHPFEVAWIQSESRDSEDYSLEQYNSFITCQCEGYQFKHAPQSPRGQIYCWHVLAAIFAMKLNTITVGETY